MERKVYALAIFWILLMQSHLIIRCYAWGNGGYSSSPSAPKYGTHDWIAEHALDWLPRETKQWIVANLNWYLYGTELPDNRRAPDGIGDTSLHHIYFSASGVLVDDAAAQRANATFNQALNFMLSGDFASAAKYAGAMTHYIADMAVFGHVMGSGTDWGAEVHHSDYEDYVGEKTSSYNSEWSASLSFDGELRLITAYDAAVELAYDTTFDRSGRGLTCVWMDENYNWSNPTFVARAIESLNLAVNYVADVLHTLYTVYTAKTTEQPVVTVTFSASGISPDVSEAILTVDGVNYFYSDLPKSFLWEVGSTHSFKWADYVGAGTGKRYVWLSASGLSDAQSGSIVVPSGGGSITANYKVQYQLKVYVNPSKAGLVDPAPGLHWYDAGLTISASATPYAGYTFNKWLLDEVEYSRESTATITMDAPLSLTAVFSGTAFTLTVYVYHASFGIQGVTVKIDGAIYATDYSGSVSVQVAPGSHVIEVESPYQPSPGVSYTFIGWSDYSTSNPRDLVVSSDTTVAAYMQLTPSGAPSGGGQQVAVTFIASGLTNPSLARSILVVDNQFYGADQLPLTFMWEVGSTHGYGWAEIVESTSEDTRFRLAFVTGLSNKSLDFITVPSEGGFIEAVYKTQYSVGIGAEAGKGTTDPPPGIYWFDAGTYVNVTAIPGPKYEFKMWRAITAADATYDRYSNPTTIWLGGPINIVAEFTEAFDYQITLTPSSISLYKGKPADISVQVERIAGEARQKIRLSLTNVPSGISYKFDVESDYPPLYATLTITASGDAPTGTHILTVRALYGEVVKEAPLSITIMEPEKAWYEQPWTLAAMALIAIVVIIAIIVWRRGT